MPSSPTPPVAKRVPSVRVRHGESVVDEYAWLRDRADPDTLAYLRAENAYCEQRLAALAPLRQQIYAEIVARTELDQWTVPARKGSYWYWSRTPEGAQYAIHYRRPATGDVGEQPPDVAPAASAAGAAGTRPLLDENALAGDADYFALGAFDVSPDGRLLAYATDHTGAESYTLRWRDLGTGTDLPEQITGTYYGTAWSADGASLLYTRHDAAMRPHEVWRHRIGTDPATDVLERAEPDERFFLDVTLTRDERYLLIGSHSMVTSEVWFCPAGDPAGPFTVVEPRRQGVEYAVDHRAGQLLIVHNDGAPNFELAVAPVATPGRAHWRPLLPHRDDTRVGEVHAFAGHVVVEVRRAAVTELTVLPADGAGYGTPFDVELPEPVHTVGTGDNPEFETGTLRLQYTSLVSPRSVYDYDLAGRTLALRKRDRVLGGVDLKAYESAREWAVAADGTRVPISLVRRRDTPRDGTAPLLLYGYGSYEASMDPVFSIPRLALLDRGMVYAIAHVRGGGELGRRWYEDGKLLRKKNTFTDFVACADRLVAAGWAAPDRIVARGASAGGLLMGAVANLAPDRFAGILAQVPFVDALNTILDPSLPLTVTEWEEWGNPVDDPEVYRYLRSYAPYENVTAAAYPALFVTAGLADPRVSYHEPAKWVARLRATATGPAPILLRTELGAGHGGRSGRYDRWNDEALYLAWALDVTGTGGTAGTSRTREPEEATDR